MSYFGDSMPLPEPHMDDAGFWRHCAERKLVFQCCGDCGAPRHPPTPVCGKCRSTRVSWRAAPERAEVFTFTIVHHAVHEAVESRLPYAVALVTFPALPGPKLVTNITDIEPARIHIGMPVTLWWDPVGENMFLPRFRPEGAEKST